MEWLAGLSWYWIAAAVGVVTFLLWYFVGD